LERNNVQTSEWKWKSRDGLEMYARSWSPEAPKAVVVLVHGHGEHVNRYPHVAEAFTNAGYALQGFDLRGHGQSGGQRGHTPSYESLMDDITDFIADAGKRYPSLPIFLYGHSMGGNQVINYVLRSAGNLKGAIVTGPWLRLAFDPPAAQVMLAKILNKIAPSFSLASTLDQSALSRDEKVVQAYAADPLVHNKISVRLYTSIYGSGLWALEHAAEIKIPMLLMHGGADKITSAKASDEFATKAGKRVSLRIWDGFYHEIHNEPQKAEVLKMMVGWLDQQI
jgi:alpha-beta hydrolase superfamily lysophospholipase